MRKATKAELEEKMEMASNQKWELIRGLSMRVVDLMNCDCDCSRDEILRVLADDINDLKNIDLSPYTYGD